MSARHKAFAAAFADLPQGTFYGTAESRRYVVSKTSFAQGRAQKLVAHALDGSDYISLNLYTLAKGPALRPCEMPAEKVIDFVLALTPDTA